MATSGQQMVVSLIANRKQVEHATLTYSVGVWGGHLSIWLLQMFIRGAANAIGVRMWVASCASTQAKFVLQLYLASSNIQPKEKGWQRAAQRR
jgi:hypothetical protein